MSMNTGNFNATLQQVESHKLVDTQRNPIHTIIIHVHFDKPPLPWGEPNAVVAGVLLHQRLGYNVPLPCAAACLSGSQIATFLA